MRGGADYGLLVLTLLAGFALNSLFMGLFFPFVQDDPSLLGIFILSLLMTIIFIALMAFLVSRKVSEHMIRV